MHETYTFKTLAADMDYLLNKYHNINEKYEPLRRFEYHGGEYDSSTGIDDAEMLAGINRIVASFGDTPDYNHQILKAKIVEYILDNTMIDINEHDYYMGLHCWGRLIKHTVSKWGDEVYEKYIGEKNQILSDFRASGTAWYWLDFDHTVPNWDNLLTLGFAGILEKAKK